MRTAALAAALLGSVALLVPAHAQDEGFPVEPGTERFSQTVLVEGLQGPWELAWGPDDWLWVTERTGGRVTRIDPADGTLSPAIVIDEVSAPGGQDGLLGMTFHPELLAGTGNDYVYLAYTYVDADLPPDPTVADEASPYRHLYAKIVRLTYDAENGTLGDPTDLIAGLPASNDHNSGRLKYGPDGMLYYTIGDQGNNQLGNYCIPIESQRLPTRSEIDAGDYVAYQGKTLRLSPEGGIPADNPEIEGVVSHVFTYGHRNMQGLDFGPDGQIYGSEHGPKADDEINILQPGGNYGWPHVSGLVDDMAYVYARWAEAEVPCDELTFSDIELPESVPFERESDWPGEQVDPIATMFTVPDDYNFQDPACGGIDFICWPTIAPSSMEVYAPEADGIPGWGNSLVMPTLKRGSLYRIALNADGTGVEGPFYRYFQSENRFRDIAFGPDARTIYVATDASGLAEATGGGTTTTMTNPGAILVFQYEGPGEPGAPAPGAAEAEPAAPAETPAAEAASEAGTELPASGERLPPLFTAAQAEAGRTAYNGNCAVCHGSTLTNGTFGTPLAGPYFETQWFGRTVADLYSYAHDHMPPAAPGSLPDQTYADITAYVLSVNGFEPSEQELQPDVGALGNQLIEQPSTE